MLIILMFLVSLCCAAFIAYRLTGSGLVAAIAGIGLGVVGMHPFTCIIIIVVAIILALVGGN